MPLADAHDKHVGASSSVCGNQSLLLRLPAELVTHVITFLPAVSLAHLSASCKQLYSIVHTDAHWKQRVLSYDLAQQLQSPAPFESWENLFLAHYPFWFLPKHRIWFADGTESDGGLAGQVIVTQYDQRTGNIVGYTLTGEKARITSTHLWPEKPNVSIHDFNPYIRLHLENPVLRLRPRPGKLPERYDRRIEREPRGLISQRSAQSDLNMAHRIDSHVMLARAIPPADQHSSMRLWPPHRMPAIERVRQFTPSLWSQMQLARHDSSSELKGTSFERPTAHTEVCETAFRLRKKLIGHHARLLELLSAGVDSRNGGSVATYSTLPTEAYRPTTERPYQGIWVGDYASHGCEFLLIRQKITRAEKQASEKVEPKVDSMADARYVSIIGTAHGPGETAPEDLLEDDESGYVTADEAGDSNRLPAGDEVGETGRLEAIKLTGDANVPRGEFTFVAEEIGKAGELYVGETAEFEGKRVVSSWGHIAARGFVDDVFIKADLILVSHDCLAQYWHEFGHVAFYRRVDIDRFSNPEDGSVVLRL